MLFCCANQNAGRASNLYNAKTGKCQTRLAQTNTERIVIEFDAYIMSN